MSTPSSAGPSLVPGPPSQNAPAAAVAPPRHNLLLWILSGVGLMVLFLVIAGTLILKLSFSMLKDVSITKSGTSVEINTPSGKIAVRKGEPADLGLPVYPGAEFSDDGGSVEFTGKDDQRSGVSGSNYRTTDPIEKVDEWYRHRLGSEFERNGPGPKSFDVNGINVEIGAGDIAYTSESFGVAIVGLKTSAGHVEISLARIGRQGQPQ